MALGILQFRDILDMVTVVIDFFQGTGSYNLTVIIIDDVIELATTSLTSMPNNNTISNAIYGVAATTEGC
jgi:hypothetical protein